MSIKKHLEMKFKKGFINHVCIVKFLKFLVKLLHMLAKNIKSNTSNTTMETLPAKSNVRLTILNDMGVIILDPNTMKSNDTAS